jgi:hypothetical protein
MRLHPDLTMRRRGYAVCGCGTTFDTSEGHEWCSTCDQGEGQGASFDPEHATRGLMMLDWYCDQVGPYPAGTELVVPLIDLLADLVHLHASRWTTTPAADRTTPEALLNSVLATFSTDQPTD